MTANRVLWAAEAKFLDRKRYCHFSISNDIPLVGWFCRLIACLLPSGQHFRSGFCPLG